jgi:3-deoxy-D-manno-octulosonic-acid transferase
MTTVYRSHSIRLALKTYEWLWRGATPLLCRNHRLQEGLSERLGHPFPKGPFDIWIQAASAGESYLAGLILDHLGSNCPHRILVTTSTRQGKDIIDAAMARRQVMANQKKWISAYFPFDRPALMKMAVASIQPRIMVLLETEIWPGLIYALKAAGIPVIIINGRIQAKSLRHYQLWPKFWHALAPDRVLAVSIEDANRYACLYGVERVSIMPNMKFDRIRADITTDKTNPVSKLIPPGVPLVVLGSVRQEEEDAVGQMIRYLLDQRPDILIGLFPRHMHRIPSWQGRLKTAGITCHMRSRITSALELAPKAVILWDVFGELTCAYTTATSAFVGGTLAPLGGQNFLEPLTCGLIPTIGPSWKTFNWVGQDLFEKGLVHVTKDWRHAADSLLGLMAAPPSRKNVIETLERYLTKRQGGTAIAVEAIEQFLTQDRPAGYRADHH